ncbi:MAG: hypothetical protein RL490_1696 [Pseudomonadota bacterium]
MFGSVAGAAADTASDTGGGAGLCAGALAILPDLACVESARGVALAGDAARARQLLDLAEAGASRFKTNFGREPLRFAVAEGRTAVISREAIGALRAAGFKVVLPWLSETVFRAQLESSIRRAVTAQLAGQPPAVLEATVQAALKQQDAAGRRSGVELAAVPHELGHDWFRAGYWPAAPLTERKHYGGPSPDWLDEMAAVLMEAPVRFDERLKQFADRYASYRKDPQNADENTRLLLDLPHYFSETHPALASVSRLLETRSAAEKQSSVRVITGDEAQRIADGSLRFYLQAAMVSRYLIDRTGDPTVFNRIAMAFVRGETIDQWLANAEPKGRLPRDVAAMQADWLGWLEKRLPAQ